MEKEEFVDYEVALRLRDLGFRDLCYAFYYTNATDHEFEHVREGRVFDPSRNFYRVGAPHLVQANRWLDDRYRISVAIREKDGAWEYSLWAVPMVFRGPYVTWEEAMLEGIKECLKLL